MEEDMGKRRCIYVTLGHRAVQQQLTELCKSTILESKKSLELHLI